MKFMSDNGIVFDKMEDCQAFEANPNFMMYDEDGALTDDGDAAMVIEIKDHNGYYLCCGLMEKQDATDRGLDDEPGYYYWDGGEFRHLSYQIFENIRAIKK